MPTLSFKRITSIWIIAILVLFVLAISFGITMRLNQGHNIDVSPVTFYSLMTVHGLTMIGIWAVAGMAAVNYLMARYVKVSTSLNVFAFVFTVVGVVILWWVGFVGKFHAGWTFLYPLPFRVAWEEWATLWFFIGLTVLGVGWLVWTLGMIMQILKKYTLSQSFAWQHFTKKHDVPVETPPFILISMVSLVGILISLITAVILLVLFYMEYFSNGSFKNDPLMMKNLTYFFGHTIANEALYLGLATLYELLPEVSGRPKFKTTWYVAVGWNCTMIFVLTAFFHHLYMDFVQPYSLQLVGQFASYFASIPSAVVTIVSVIVLIWGNKIKWSLTNLFFFLGMVGWIIGGVGALIDSTISNNVILHNTLWVPAHFHTYNVMGNVLFSLAFFVWAANEFAGKAITGLTKTQQLTLALMVIGGFGFVLMFYYSGAFSVPRRYATYPDELSIGAKFASWGAWFASAYLLAILIFMGSIVSKCTKIFSSRQSA